MPTKAISRYETKNRTLLAVIEKYRMISGIRMDQMNVVIDSSPATFRRRKANPDTLTVEELRAIQRTLKIPPEELFPAIL